MTTLFRLLAVCMVSVFSHQVGINQLCQWDHNMHMQCATLWWLTESAGVFLNHSPLAVTSESLSFAGIEYNVSGNLALTYQPQ